MKKAQAKAKYSQKASRSVHNLAAPKFATGVLGKLSSGREVHSQTRAGLGDVIVERGTAGSAECRGAVASVRSAASSVAAFDGSDGIGPLHKR